MVGIIVSVATDSIDLVFMIGLVSVSNCYYSLYLRACVHSTLLTIYLHVVLRVTIPRLL